MNESIKSQLHEMAEEGYRKFSAALIPNIDNVLGVRLPALRKMAKAIAAGDWRTYLKHADDEYFEEVMLQAMVIGYAKADIVELLRYVADFVPKMDNWSVCDSFCIGLKVTNANKARVWEFLQPYLRSDKEYELRFGIVMLLDYYVAEDYIHKLFPLLDRIRHEGYYVKMAVAWALSICYIHFPDLTMAYLRNNSLDDFTYNKALQKITESYRVDHAAKQTIRSMKRKK